MCTATIKEHEGIAKHRKRGMSNQRGDGLSAMCSFSGDVCDVSITDEGWGKDVREESEEGGKASREKPAIRSLCDKNVRLSREEDA